MRSDRVIYENAKEFSGAGVKHMVRLGMEYHVLALEHCVHIVKQTQQLQLHAVVCSVCKVRVYKVRCYLTQ